MATLNTNGDFIGLTPAEFNAYSLIRYSLAEPNQTVRLGLTISGVVNFATRLGSVSAVIDGWTGNDNITSGSGNDSLWGNSGNDTLTAGAGDDVLFGDWDIDNRTGNDALYGGDGNDELIGGPGNDYLSGGSGDDFFSYGELVAGSDSLFGGAGIDRVSVRDVFGTGLGEVGFNKLVLSSAASIEYFSWDDTSVALRGTSGADLIDFSGTTVLTWTGSNYEERISFDLGAGNDSFTGGLGAETITVSGGGDRISLGGGDDTLMIVGGTFASNTMSGGAGLDVLDLGQYGNGPTDMVTNLVSLGAAAGFEILHMGPKAFAGTIGADRWDFSGIQQNFIDLDTPLEMGAGNDAFTGSQGDDLINGGAGLDTLYGGLGDDVFYMAAGETHFDVINGGSGRDTIRFTGGPSIATGAPALAGLVIAAGSSIEVLDFTPGVVVHGTALANVFDLHNLAVDPWGFGGQTRFAMDDGNDRFTGSYTSDSVNGGAGNDTLLGGGGDDWLLGDAGRDSMVGGLGNDRYGVDDLTDIFTELADQGTDTILTSLSTFTIGANFENLSAVGSGGLVGTGNSLANEMVGAEGRDRLLGLAGNDVLDGGAGIDTLEGGLGDDTYSAGLEDMLIEVAGGGTDTVISGLRQWTLAQNFENLWSDTATDFQGTGNAAANLIGGSAGNDTLRGEGGNDTLWGQFGDDLLDGGSGIDSLYGGAGNDRYIVDSEGGIFEGANSGNDTVISTSRFYTLGDNLENLRAGSVTSGIDLTGNNLDNSITGSRWADRLDGGWGNDTLIGNGGNDVLNGNVGDDTYLLGGIATGVQIIEAMDSGFDTVYSGANVTRLADNVETLILTRTTGATGIGSRGENTLIGNTGADRLEGEGGADSLDGGLGADSMYGGYGDDLFIIEDVGDVAVDVSGGGYDQVQVAVSGVVIRRFIEVIVITTTSGVFVTANDSSNEVYGGAGDDSILGMDGKDSLTGGAGADYLEGGRDDDTYRSVDATDRVVEAARGGYDKVWAIGPTHTLAANVEELIQFGSGDFEGIGNAGDNRITLASIGSSLGNENTLSGMDGNDTLFASPDDTIYGGSGNDVMHMAGGAGGGILDGGSGDDVYYLYEAPIQNGVSGTVIEAADAGHDKVFVYESIVLSENVEDVVLASSFAEQNATGNVLNNVIVGNGYANRISGMLGNDTLTGGLGADQFVFETVASVDTITDFVPTSGDRIVLSISAFAGLSATTVGGHIRSAEFKGIGDSSTDTSDRMLYNRYTGEIFYDVDGRGGVDAVLIALVAPQLALNETHFWVI